MGVSVFVHHAKNMQLTVTTEDDKIVAVEVDPTTEVVNLKAILEAETDIQSAQQALIHNGKELTDSSTLATAGVGDGDLIMVLQRQRQATGGAGGGNPTGLNADGSAIDPNSFQAALKSDANLMRQLQNGNPQLHAAILNPDTTEMQRLLRLSHQQRQQAEAARNAEIDLLNADPFDLEAQKKIEESIRLKNVDANYETAVREDQEESFERQIAKP